ncbi:phage tail protein I [Chromobacterium violaceum]|uniref:phage tail protein I n=1 Tax=Chromobacterium violaceum TaxID=536 RepID=UPI00143D03BD|nr:phage tail protein I [Chromobacterium violaceum]QIY78344.1 phage tail protein I [Chromobacterium violaceum]
MSRHLLPPNVTPLEQALADAMAPTVDPSVIATLADSARCPPAMLPWLAWERSVEQFDKARTEEQRRAMIRSSLAVHRQKGTISAVRQVFRDLGLGEVRIDEGTAGYCYDGAVAFDGFASYGDPDGWAEYRVRIDKLLSVEQAAAARALLDDVAPARCVLWGLDFSGAELIYNDMAAFDGKYTYGVA